MAYFTWKWVRKQHRICLVRKQKRVVISDGVTEMIQWELKVFPFETGIR